MVELPLRSHKTGKLHSVIQTRLTSNEQSENVECYSVRISEFGVLEIRHIFESVRVDVLTDKGGVTFGVSSDNQESQGEENQDQSHVEADMDVQGVEVSWRPFGLEQLRANSISSGPSDD